MGHPVGNEKQGRLNWNEKAIENERKNTKWQRGENTEVLKVIGFKERWKVTA